MRGNGAGVAEPLHHHARALYWDSQVLATAQRGKVHAAAGGFVAAQRAAEADRFAGHHAVHRVALVHAVGVHDPRHDLRRGIDVGRRDVLFRTDERQDGRRISPGHAFQFTHRHFFRVAGHAALAAAEGNIHHGALPRHPRGQRFHLIHGYVGVVAYAALGRTARGAVLHTVAFEANGFAGVHPDGDAHAEDAFGIFDHCPYAVIEIGRRSEE